VVEGLRDQARRVSTVGDFIREQREQTQVSMRQLAKRAGVSNPYLSQIERGLRRPSAEILQQIAKGLRISAEQLYLRAGMLETRDGDPETIAVILADRRLSEQHKHTLIQIYESFSRENAVSATTDTHPAPTAIGDIPA
jgi:transcriptional regulator with XRE-family HTH domain